MVERNGDAALSHMSRPQAPRPVRLRDAVAANNLLGALVLIVTIVVLLIGPQLFVPDSWLTLVSGREVARHGLPHHEVTTTIARGRVWTDQQWLAHLIYYGLDRTGGLGLTVVFHALMVGGALATTVIASRVRGATARMTLLAAVVGLLIAPWSWQLRAQSVALPLFALTLALLATDPRRSLRRSYLVFPVLILWANIHGSVILGAALVSLAGAVALVSLARRPPDAPATPWWRSCLFLIAPWACVLASPYGTDLVAYYRLLLYESPVSRTIQEWKAPAPSGYLLVFFTVAAATGLFAVWQRRRLSAYDLAVLALTIAGALRSGRGIAWFSIAVAMLIPVALDGIAGANTSRTVHRRLAYTLTVSLSILLVTAAVYAAARDDSYYEQAWPARAAQATAAAARTHGTVWASDEYADWLLWKQPSLRGHIAWDVRFELLTEDEIQSLIAFKLKRPGWQAQAQRYPVLALDQTETGAQTRLLRHDPATNVEYSSPKLVVLSHRRTSLDE
jgi:hypothetical protein